MRIVVGMTGHDDATPYGESESCLSTPRHCELELPRLSALGVPVQRLHFEGQLPLTLDPPRED